MTAPARGYERLKAERPVIDRDTTLHIAAEAFEPSLAESADDRSSFTRICECFEQRRLRRMGSIFL